MGLFDLFNSPQKAVRQEELDDEQQAYRVATMTPGQTASYLAYSGGMGAGKGLGQAVGGAFGVDTRSTAQRNAAAIEEVKRAVAEAGIDPSDLDKFYPLVIRELGKRGLLGEAQAMAREFEELKLKKQDRTIRQGQLDRMNNKDIRDNEAAQARITRMGGEYVQLLNMMDETAAQLAAMDEGDPRRAGLETKQKRVLQRLDALSAGKGVKTVNLGDRVQIVDAGTGEVIREVGVGAKPGATRGTGKAGEPGAQTGDGTGDSGLKEGAKKDLAGFDTIMELTRQTQALLTANADAVGLKGFLWKPLLDRIDPQGVEARAAIGNLASSLIKERSGAAVSAQEFARLQPFVPQDTDTAGVAIKKLGKLYNDAGVAANALRGANGLPPVNYPGLAEFNPNYRREGPAATAKPATPTPQRRSTDGDAQPARRRKFNPATGELE